MTAHEARSIIKNAAAGWMIGVAVGAIGTFVGVRVIWETAGEIGFGAFVGLAITVFSLSAPVWCALKHASGGLGAKSRPTYTADDQRAKEMGELTDEERKARQENPTPGPARPTYPEDFY